MLYKENDKKHRLTVLNKKLTKELSENNENNSEDKN